VLGDLEQQVVEEIQRVAKSQLELELAVQPHHDLARDLMLDSLGLTVVAVALEDRFRVRLTEEDSAGVATVADLARLVSTRVREATP
jgi:acyl carrier protein